MGGMRTPDEFAEYVHDVVDHLDQNHDEQQVFLTGDVTDVDLDADPENGTKTIRAEIEFPAAMFEEDGIEPLKLANYVLFASIGFPVDVLSEQGQELLDGEIDEIKVDV